MFTTVFMLTMFSVYANADTNSSNSSKVLTVHYTDLKGRKLSNNKEISTNGDYIPAFNSINIDNLNNSSWNGYVKKIHGYMPFYNYNDISYGNLPKTITVKYEKCTTINKNVNKSYMKQLNSYRRKKGLKYLSYNKLLANKALIRSRELFKKFDHVRPNGKSYNKKNSGYGEVIASFPTQFIPSKIPGIGLGSQIIYSKNGSINYRKTAGTTLHEFLTEDKIHRGAVLNNWAKYSCPSFNFQSDTSAVMVQLFKY